MEERLRDGGKMAPLVQCRTFNSACNPNLMKKNVKKQKMEKNNVKSNITKC